MSEYQYYEFRAIDRPLTDAEQTAVRALSSRVEPSRTRAVFTYSYSNFRSDPLKVLEQYFDALLYVANWGSKQLAFRFPIDAVDRQQFAPYEMAVEEISLTSTPKHIILNISFHEEEGLEWIDGEGSLDAMLPLREDLMRGDPRALYLAWLKAAPYLLDEQEEWAGDEPDEDDLDDESADEMHEPPVPAGLGQLSAALQSFVEFFDIDSDLIAVAAEASPPLGSSDEQVEQSITKLPEVERNAFLLRVVRGEPNVAVQLQRRLRDLGDLAGKTVGKPAATRRTLAELLMGAEQHRQHRIAQEREEAERARLRRLEELATREPAVWSHVMGLIEQKQTKAYDEAVARLVELRDLADHRGRRTDYDRRLEELRSSFGSRTALIQRLRRARLI